jgi:multimeric flavodoxin WrbA
MSAGGTANRILGLGCGQPHGSAEILLKSALRAAEAAGAEVELVRLDELRLPSGAAEAAEPDDGWWLWERLVGCDGLIVSTPIISRTVAARLKLFGDRMLGPNADAAIIEGLLALRRQGQEPAVPFRVDERVLKPRVAGFLAVGGSLTPQWKTLTLPLMHATTFSMHIAVVDQVQFEGAGTPRSVVLDPAALDRPARPPRRQPARHPLRPGPLPRPPRPVPPVPPGRHRPARHRRRVRHLRRPRPPHPRPDRHLDRPDHLRHHHGRKALPRRRDPANRRPPRPPPRGNRQASQRMGLLRPRNPPHLTPEQRRSGGGRGAHREAPLRAAPHWPWFQAAPVTSVHTRDGWPSRNRASLTVLRDGAALELL